MVGDAERAPTSAILEGLLKDAPREQVTVGWIVDHLGDRSFGVVMLLIALVGLVPPASALSGILLMVPAYQMILARKGPILPRVISKRSLSTQRLFRLIERLAPVLKWLERLVRPRWGTPFEATKRVVGAVILLLCLTLLAPIPFSHVIPVFVIMLIAFAFLEEDGMLLCVGLFAAAVSLAITAAAVWGAVETSLIL